MTTCRVCGTTIDGARLTIDPAPSGAQHFASTASEARANRICLEIVACAACGLVQSASPPVPAYRRAITAAGVSAPMRSHRLDQARRLAAALDRAGARLALVGCGSGYELPLLVEAGFRPEGIESGGAPSGPAAQWLVHDGYPELGATLPGAPYDAFACYNFLEHAPDPRGFLSAIAHSLCESGMGVVEVPNYARQRVDGRAADFIADHVSYFDADTLRTTLALSGFDVVSLAEVRGGENLESIVRRRAAPPFAAHADLLRATQRVAGAFFAKWRGAGKSAVAWGASHQALTLLAGVTPADAPTAIIDSADFKRGRFAPPTGIAIVAPSAEAVRGAGAVLIMASGYEREIAESLRSTLAFTGEIWSVHGQELQRLD